MNETLEIIQKTFTGPNLISFFEGAMTSLMIAVICLIAGIILGTIAVSGKIGKNKVGRLIANLYVEIIRGTPMLLQITLIYIGLPILYRTLFDSYLDLSPLIAGIIAISINSGAYICELIRGSINSIDKGQWEAGKTLGLPHKKIMSKIILPQAFKRIVPPLANELIILVKDSSLVSTIGVMELLKNTEIIYTRLYTFFIPMMGAAAFYLTMTLTISHFAKKLEMRLAESD